MSDLFAAPVPYPMDAYRDDTKSIGAAVEWACGYMGIFRGEKVQRSELLSFAQHRHKGLNNGDTCPQHETLGRELRHRNPKRISPDIVRQRMHFADRLWAKGWRLYCVDGRVWAVRV